MTVIRGRPVGGASVQHSATFTGTVWADPLLPKTDGVAISNIFFPPQAHSNWHQHENGQILMITAGSGFVCDQGEEPSQINAGDLVWLPAGGTHWHGASPTSYLVQLSFTLGTTTWKEPVSEEEYDKAVRALS